MSDQEKRIQEIIDDLKRKNLEYDEKEAYQGEFKRNVIIITALEFLQRERQELVQPTRGKNIEICTISGCEGECVALNQYRIAGPKPYGGGLVVKRWNTSLHDISNALRGIATLTPIATEPKGEATT